MRLTAVIPCEPEGYRRPRTVARCPRNVAACAAKRCHPITQVFMDPKDQAYRKRCVEALQAAYAGAPLEGAVAISVRFILPRPKADGQGARYWHEKRGDTDNFLKAIKDAGTDAGWWHDDGQVARVVAEKVVGAFGEEPRAHVLVQTLAPFGAEEES